MAKPNYQYEKRQRELEKKKKKESKALKKTSPSDGNVEQTAPEQTPPAPDGEAPAA